MMGVARWAAEVEDARVAGRCLARLPSFLRRPVTSEEARHVVRSRLAHRDEDFLAVVDRLVLGAVRSPYRHLLALAGCERGDLVRLVRQDGVEGALERLCQSGVFLTVDEFKGRRPIVRGSATVASDPADLCNPASLVHVVAHSSGSRGPRTPVPLDLASVRDHAVNRRLSLEARGALGWRHAVWGVPGGGELVIVLRFAVSGAPIVRWFSPIDPAGPGLHPRYRWSGRAMRWAGAVSGVSLPEPRHVPADEPGEILAWMTTTLRAGLTPHLKTFASLAVRLCAVARHRGLSLDGVRFTLTGEPLTPARVAVIEAAGARAWPDYGSTESGQVGEPCLAPAAADDLHLCHDLHAVIQPGAAGLPAGLPPGALLVTSLRPTAPLVLLNVSMGDEAWMGPRACGCPMEGEGWPHHLHTVRSFEKLTGSGMTFLDSDMVRVMEEVLPSRFGGTPAHYQLVEDQGPEGQPRLRLVVDPEVGLLDERSVAEVFLSAIGRASAAATIVEQMWRATGVLHVERRRPLATPSGKVLHLHRQGLAREPESGSSPDPRT